MKRRQHGTGHLDARTAPRSRRVGTAAGWAGIGAPRVILLVTALTLGAASFVDAEIEIQPSSISIDQSEKRTPFTITNSSQTPVTDCKLTLVGERGKSLPVRVEILDRAFGCDDFRQVGTHVAEASCGSLAAGAMAEGEMIWLESGTATLESVCHEVGHTVEMSVRVTASP